MQPVLIALAGPSRSGKGTCASAFIQEADARGLTSRERQLSGPGKQYVASAWWPEITEQEAIELFDRVKIGSNQKISFTWLEDDTVAGEPWKKNCGERVTLQQYLQRMLQGARDRWGEMFWTDKLIPLGSVGPRGEEQVWWQSFEVPWDGRSNLANICIISDLRQVNEAQRVRDLGGVVVEIHRPTNDDAYRTGTAHVTEQRLPAELVDYTIINDGTLEDLRAKAVDLFTTMLNRMES